MALSFVPNARSISDDSAPKGVYTPTPTPTASPVNVNGEKTPRQQDRPQAARIQREMERSLRTVVRSVGLSDLKNSKLAPDDIEIRLLALPGLYIVNIKCWVFSRKSGQWTSHVFIDPDFKKKIVKKTLSVRSDAWPTWDSYVSREITPARIRGPLPEPEPLGDGIAHVIEVKFGNDHARRLLPEGHVLFRDFLATVKTVILDNKPLEMLK